MADSIEVLRAALRYIEHTANGKQELLVEQMRNAIRALSPAGGDWVMVPREAVAQAAAALDIQGRRDLAAWLMRSVAASPQQEPGPAINSAETYSKPIADPSGQTLAGAGSRESRMVVLRRDASGIPSVWCDPEISDLVAALNAGGVPTVASCSGHGERHGNIALKDGRELLIASDFDTARAMDALLLTATSAGTTGGDSEDAARLAEVMAQRDRLHACGCGCSRKCCPSCGEEILGPLSWLDPNDPTARAARRAREVG